MFDAVLVHLLAAGGLYLAFFLFFEVRLWRCTRDIKLLKEAMLSDTRRGAAKMRWDNPQQLEALARSLKTNPDASSFDEVPDKWGGMLNR